MERCLWRFFPEKEGFGGWHRIPGCGNANLCRTLAREGVLGGGRTTQAWDNDRARGEVANGERFSTCFLPSCTDII